MLNTIKVQLLEFKCKPFWSWNILTINYKIINVVLTCMHHIDSEINTETKFEHFIVHLCMCIALLKLFFFSLREHRIPVGNRVRRSLPSLKLDRLTEAWRRLLHSRYHLDISLHTCQIKELSYCKQCFNNLWRQDNDIDLTSVDNCGLFLVHVDSNREVTAHLLYK